MGLESALMQLSAGRKAPRLYRMFPAIEKKLAEGMEPRRLADALAAVDKPRDCEQPETKRFLVKTQLTSDGPNTSVGFSNGIVTVSGQGATARNAEGRAEAWFEPNEPITEIGRAHV